VVAIVIGGCILTFLYSQSSKKFLYEGNKAYKSKDYYKAIENYTRAYEKGDTFISRFNLGNSLYRIDSMELSLRSYYESLGKAKTRKDSAILWYNIGNSLFMMGKYGEAVEAYKKSLIMEPGDEDARYNLVYAMSKLRNPPPQPQSQQNKNDNKQDQQKQGNNNNTQNKQNKEDKEEKAQSSSRDKNEYSNIFNAINQKEKDLQEKVRAKMVENAKRYIPEKDW